jgi:hypothetical protein
MRAGYFVVRSAGSHGPADLVALQKGCWPLLVQAKSAGAMTHNDWNTLIMTAEHAEAVPIIVRWNGTHRELEWHQMLGRHTPKSQHWPAHPTQPDTLRLCAAADG